MGVKQHLSFMKKFFSVELSAAMEYRFNFVAQTIGMFLNDAIWVLFWFIVFQKFEQINGWHFEEMALLYALLTISFGLATMLFGNFRRFVLFIENGTLDYYLTLPKNVLVHTLMKFRYSGLGDFLFGIVVAIFVLTWSEVPLFLVFVIFSMIFILSWAVLVGSMTFFLGRFEAGARAANDSLLLFGTYPFSVFSGFSKFVLLFVIPAGFVTGIPISLIQDFNWEWFGILVGFMILLSAFAIWVFYKGLRRYESGNTNIMRG